MKIHHKGSRSEAECRDVIADTGNRQLGELIDKSSRSIASLTGQLREIGGAVSEIETLTESVSASAASLSSLITETLSALNQNAVLNEELGKKFDEVGAEIQNSGEGAKQVRQTLALMKDTVFAAGEAANVLLGKISSMNSILKEINKITMRTNMLSINASIEAAKAGASGKGFAVVATEIKSLADESSESSTEIQQIISELFKQVEDVAAKTAAGTKSALAGLESMDNLMKTLDKVRNANDEVMQAVSTASGNNSIVNTRIETVAREIDELVSSAGSISGTAGSVFSKIEKQSEAAKAVGDSVGRLREINDGK